ncbi:MAG TPA: DUF6491 family protein [Allosphingosinicella sp.]|jgi:hypothetical protein
MRNIILPLLAAAVLTTSAPAFAAPPEQQGAPPRAEQARIPFPGLRIRNFRAESREVVYLEDQSRNWYRAELFGPCTDLRFANAIGIDTRGSSSFDRFSAIIVSGERCQLRSLTRSAEPPKLQKAKGRRG